MRLLTGPLCTILLSLLTGDSFATLFNFHDWSNARTYSYQLSSKFEPVQIKSMRVDASESCNSHQLSSTLIFVCPGLNYKFVCSKIKFSHAPQRNALVVMKGTLLMGNLHYRLIFDPFKSGNIPKFGWKML